MKKFLFTLAALLMAGSAVANDYFFINDVELTKEEAATGKTLQVDVMAHFEAMVSAFTVDFGTGADAETFVPNVLPADLTITAYNVKQSTARVSYLYWDSDAEELVDDTCVPSIGVAQNNTRYIGITSAMDSEWDEIDGVATNCGAIKWKPGEFRMFKVTFTIPANFQGAEVGIRTQPQCGNDPRGNTSDAVTRYSVFKLTVEAGEDPLPAFVAEADVTVDADGLFTLKYKANDPNAVVTVDGADVTFTLGEDGYYTATYQVEKGTTPGDYSKTITLTVAPSEAYEGTAVSDDATYNWTVEKPVFAAEAEVTVDADGLFTLKYKANDPNAVVTVDGADVTFTQEGEYMVATYQVEKGTTPGDYSKTITLTVAPSNDYQGAAVSDDATYTWTVEKPVFAAEAEVTVDENGLFTLKYKANDPNAVVTVDGADVTFAQEGEYMVATYQVVKSEVPGEHSETVTLTVAPSNNYQGQAVSDEATYTYNVLEKTATPVIKIIRYGEYAYQFVIENEDKYAEGTEIHVYVDGVEVFKQADFDGHERYWIIADEGADRDFVITATAQEPGKLISDTARLEGTIAGRESSVDELNGNKTVAGVRYYNMAGQEMQEANGMTIVVTTYTDGTTSAVKVMK